MTTPTFTEEQVRRYARHIILPGIGGEGQRKLLDAKVLCIGAGGLGSPVAMYLAAAGVGTLGIVDFDKVDESNLQRQIVHSTADVGRPKVESAVDRLRAINPTIEIVPYDTILSSRNAFEVLEPWDVVVDGTDNFPVRYLVNDATQFLGKPLVYGSIYQWDGQATVFMPGQDAPCYRCLFPQPPPPGTVPSCAEGGVFGALPGIVGLDPGDRGRQAHHRQGRPADRPAADLRRARDGLPDREGAVGRRLPRVRQGAHDHRADRLRGVLRAHARSGAARGRTRGERLVTRVKLPTILRSHAGGERDVDASGATLRELLADLESRYPGVTAMVLTDDGALHRFVNVYVNDEDVRYLGSLETPVDPGDTISILPAVAGGS